jgi:hypothetical protein
VDLELHHILEFPLLLPEAVVVDGMQEQAHHKEILADRVVVIVVDHKALADQMQELLDKEILVEVELVRQIQVDLVVEEEEQIHQHLLELEDLEHLEIILVVQVVMVFNFQQHSKIQYQE